jgi:PmbA protein
MTDLSNACELAEKAAIKAGADEAEAYASLEREVEVFIERNDIKLGKAHSKATLGVRLFKKKSLGFAVVNDLSSNSIKEAVSNAIKMARASPADLFNALPQNSKIKLLSGIYDRRAENFEPKETLEKAVLMLRTAKDYDKRVTVDSGTFNSSLVSHAIRNSNGIEAAEKISMFSWAIIGMAVEGKEVSSFDYQSGGTHNVKEIDAERSAKEFAINIVESLGARKAESFTGTVLFSPDAVAEVIVSPIIASSNANSVQKWMSKFASKLGKKIADESLTVIDDGTFVKGLAAASFDREGVPHKKLKVVENGVLRSFMHNTYTAAKDGVKSTGHAAGGARNSPAVGPTNIIIPEGSEKLDSVIKEIRKGLLVTRFSGNASSVSGDFSGVVKGGFLIENGRKKFPVKETLIAGNIYESIVHIKNISKERKMVGTFLLPYLCIDKISITAG